MPSTVAEVTPLVNNLMLLLCAYQVAFKQQRVYRRAVALLLGEILVFGRHTVTQILMSLGVVDEDWSAWYRLLSHRFQEDIIAVILFTQIIMSSGFADESQPLVMGIDGTQVPRSSTKMEGTSWLRNHRTPVFMRGIHRAQRFVHAAVLLPITTAGYSRAIPLRFLPAFPDKAVCEEHEPRKEWQVGLDLIVWVRQQLDRLGRTRQRLLVLADGAYDNIDLWRQLPPIGVTLLVRTAKNRALYHLPTQSLGRGRPRKYGQRAMTPQQVLDWTHKQHTPQNPVWQDCQVMVRGRERTMRYRVLGPYVRKGAANRPLFLIVVSGQTYHQGTRYRKPVYYLVNAIWRNGAWCLPLPIETLLMWAWQRWELEVTHRELKSAFGLGEKQCWNPKSAITSVQWSAWCYALIVLVGYQSWGLSDGPPVPTKWWPGARRWSINTLLRGFRAELFGRRDFKALISGTGGDWVKNSSFADAMWNAVHGATRD